MGMKMMMKTNYQPLYGVWLDRSTSDRVHMTRFLHGFLATMTMGPESPVRRPVKSSCNIGQITPRRRHTGEDTQETHENTPQRPRRTDS